MGWITARSLFESIEAAKSTDADKIIEALENWKVPAGNASYSYRKCDHQMLVRNLAVSVKDKITDKWDYFDVQGDAAGEPGRPRQGVRDAGGNRLQDGLSRHRRQTMLDILLSQTAAASCSAASTC